MYFSSSKTLHPQLDCVLIRFVAQIICRQWWPGSIQLGRDLCCRCVCIFLHQECVSGFTLLSLSLSLRHPHALNRLVCSDSSNRHKLKLIQRKCLLSPFYWHFYHLAVYFLHCPSASFYLFTHLLIQIVPSHALAPVQIIGLYWSIDCGNLYCAIITQACEPISASSAFFYAHNHNHAHTSKHLHFVRKAALLRRPATARLIHQLRWKR